MGFKGSVESFSLADVFQNLAMNQQTGTLRVYTVGGDERLVYFRTGQVQSLARGAGEPLLKPEVFLARGYIVQAQLDAALVRQKETLSPPAACLIEQGVLTDEQVNEVIKLQIEEEIYDLFGWEKANFEFNEGPAAAGMFTTLSGGKSPGLPISHLIMEAARRVDEWERLRKQVSSFKEVYSMDAAVGKAIEKGEMDATPVEKRVVSLIDCARDVEDIIQDSYLFRFEVLTALGDMIQSSLVRTASLAELTQAEQECLRQNLPRRRIKLLERILAMGGENPKVRRELADALARDQRVDTACIHFAVLAEKEMQEKRQEPAIDLYRRILSLSPKHVKAHEQLAAIYAKRGQKREAFVHYLTLFETFRDQSHPREARAAAIAALECDPLHADLRTNLIELLLTDNQKDAAAQQLEVQGDQAARVGNVKLAADSYRRAMQMAPANKHLKRKLADVMLTKEDRLARKRKAWIALVAVVLVGVVAAAGVYKERSNAGLLARVEAAAAPVLAQGAECEANGDFDGARRQFEAARDMYAPLTQVFSPVLKCDEKATAVIRRLSDQAAEAGRRAGDEREKGERQSDRDIEKGEAARKGRRVLEAREFYEKVLKNPSSSDKNKLAAKEGMEKAQQEIDGFEKALRRLKNPNPTAEFANVEDEASEKRRLIEEFRNFPGFDPAIVEMPLLIQPDTDGVQVFLDGRPVGSATAAGGRDVNTFRYPAVGTHKFEFRKPGFKTVTLNTGAQRTPVFVLRVEREPNVQLSLKAALGPDVTLSGEPVCDGGSIFVGTSEGGLLEVREGENPVVRQYKLPGGGALHKEVYGPIYPHKVPGKDTVFVYCTLAGDCIGLKAAGNTFKPAWEAVKAGAVPMTAPPSVVKIKLLSNPVMAMPLDRNLVMVDCAEGIQAAGSPVDFKATIIAPPAGIEQDALIVAGVKSGQAAKFGGYSLRDKTVREWNPAMQVGGLRSKAVPFDDDILAGADDGSYYLFKPSNPNLPPGRLVLEGAGAIVSEPLIVKKRLFVGTVEKEGFWCADLVRREHVWKAGVTGPGGVQFPPAVLDNTLYFGTDTGRVYALDVERGMVRWMYQVEGGSRVVGSPVVIGRRVYVLCAEGRVLGFDE